MRPMEPISIGDEMFTQVLLCPVCEGENTHLEKIEPHKEGKDGRLSARLHFSCEGHEGPNFVLNFLQHKGCTHVELVK